MPARLGRRGGACGAIPSDVLSVPLYLADTLLLPLALVIPSSRPRLCQDEAYMTVLLPSTLHPALTPVPSGRARATKGGVRLQTDLPGPVRSLYRRRIYIVLSPQAVRTCPTWAMVETRPPASADVPWYPRSPRPEWMGCGSNPPVLHRCGLGGPFWFENRLCHVPTWDQLFLTQNKRNCLAVAAADIEKNNL